METTSTLGATAAPRAGRAFILVAVEDPMLVPEATHTAAATSCEIVASADPRDIARFASHATAVLVDAATAAHVGSLTGGRGAGVVYFLAPDPGPIDYEAALRCRADQAFILPAESKELLAVLGEAVHGREAVAGGRSGGGLSGGPIGKAPRRGHVGRVVGGRGLAGGASSGPAGAVVGAEGMSCGRLAVAVVGACGGVGASATAAILARLGARQGSATLIDAAAHSGGLDLLLGLEAAAGARWPDLRFGEGPVDGDDLRAALPATADGVALLSVARSTIDDPFELSGDALSTALDSLAGCQEPGLTVVDCPAELLEQCAEAVDHVVILAAAEVRAAAAAAKIVSRLSARRVDHSLVVRHRDWSGLSVADVEHIVGCDAVAELPTVRGLTKRVETVGLGGGIPRPLQRSGQLILAAAGWGQ